MQSKDPPRKAKTGAVLARLRPQSVFLLVFVCVLCLSLTHSESGADSDRTDAEQDDLDKRLERLRALPYTSVTPDQVNPDSAGVMVYDPDKAHPGYNLYCCEACPDIMLIDMSGNLVHRWRDPDGRLRSWHHAIMLANGDAVAIAKSPKCLVRLDWDSRIIWKKSIRCHHDVAVLPDSTFYVIVAERKKYRALDVEFFSIVHLAPSGGEIAAWSAFEHLDEIRQASDPRSFLDTILDSMLADEDPDEVLRPMRKNIAQASDSDGGHVYDYFHINTISVLPQTSLGAADRRFRVGNLLICLRNVNQIAVLDKDSREVLWVWGEEILEWPHHPTMLENGNILVFDNGVERKYSRVIELDPVTRTIEWEYVGDPPGSFYSYTRGSAQRLPNGNTLISEGDTGRAFEVTRGGEIVWEWLNPAIIGKHRAQVYRMIRIPREVAEPLLAGE